MFDFKIFEEENLFVPDETLITPALVSQILEACQWLFRRQYNLEPKTLQALGMSKIPEKSLNIDLLPVKLREQCMEFTEQKLPHCYPEMVSAWSVD